MLMLMNCYLFLRCDFSQERAVPVMLREDSSTLRRVRGEEEVIGDFKEGCFCAVL